MTKLASKLVLDGNGSYLGMEKGCFVLKDKKGSINRYPLFEQEIKEVTLKSGNYVSTGALASMGFWDIDVTILTQKGRPVAILKSLDDDSHVQTRISQYEALSNGKVFEIAKTIVKTKLESQNILLNKYGLELHSLDFKSKIDKLESPSFDKLRYRLNGIEGKHTQKYYQQIFSLIPEKLRPKTREGFMAYDGTNNLFNLGYEVLSWRIHASIIKAKLEPYLGFLHSVQFGKPSLVCDFQELYRYLIDDFVIQFCQGVNKRDFIAKTENATRKHKAKREYLNNSDTNDFLKELDRLFEGRVEIARIKHGNSQAIDTLINEEILLLAKYLRNEQTSWIPRVPIFMDGE